jgi:hypothetical protein
MRKLNFVRICCFLSVWFLVCPLMSWARPTTPEEAKTLVQKWLEANPNPLNSPLSGTVKKVDTFSDPDGKPLYFIVYLDPAGVIIVSGDDMVEPVIGFLPEATTFDPSPANPLGALVTGDLPARIHYVRQIATTSSKAKLTPEAELQLWRPQMKWATALAPLSRSKMTQKAATISNVWVDSFVQTKWDQGDIAGDHCYNYYTPDHDVCGCLATAMAQVMKYYDYPTAGIGVHPFSITVDGTSQTALTRGGDGLGGAYVWGQMILDPASTPPTIQQRQAIGSLCFDAGVAIHMQYTSGASSARYDAMPPALLQTFQYPNAIGTYDYQNSIDTRLLATMLNSNLNGKYPCMLGIYGSPGGHAIVCDGYGYDTNTLYHHLNMGWSGYDNAWYNLPTIEAFNFVVACIYNIFPNGTGEIIAGRVTDQSGNPISGATVTAVSNPDGISYTATTDSKGIYAVSKVPSNKKFDLGAAKTGYTFFNRTVNTGLSQEGEGAQTGNVWSGACDFVDGMELPIMLTLMFQPLNPHIQGQVRADPASVYYTKGQVVTLYATPEVGNKVKSWSGTDDDSSTSTINTVTMSESKIVTVTFEQKSPVFYSITSSVVGTHGQLWPLDLTYLEGSVVVVSCEPDPGYRVKKWTGTDDDSLTTNTNTVTMTGDKTLTVEFEAIPASAVNADGSAATLTEKGSTGGILPSDLSVLPKSCTLLTVPVLAMTVFGFLVLVRVKE